jgi:hypothetical protein
VCVCVRRAAVPAVPLPLPCSALLHICDAQAPFHDTACPQTHHMHRHTAQTPHQRPLPTCPSTYYLLLPAYAFLARAWMMYIGSDLRRVSVFACVCVRGAKPRRNDMAVLRLTIASRGLLTAEGGWSHIHMTHLLMFRQRPGFRRRTHCVNHDRTDRPGFGLISLASGGSKPPE